MNFRKVIELPHRTRKWSRSDQMALWGSCFASELCDYLYRELYDVVGAPYGVMYNPHSIAMGLRRLLREERPVASELWEHRGEWHSFLHHGDYSDASKERALGRMQRDFDQAFERVSTTQLWVFTFGTAYYYHTNDEENRVVNNCHRLPSDRFCRSRMSVEEIVAEWKSLLSELLGIMPDSEVILTVSPIPHYRDGAHDSRISKATLLLAIDQLVDNDRIHYFPSYEIQVDELRDYRFYREDFAHPTEQAVRYIMSRFATYALDADKDRALQERWHKLRGQLEHRPLTTDREQLVAYYESLSAQLSDFMSDFPHDYLRETALNLETILTQLHDERL